MHANFSIFLLPIFLCGNAYVYYHTILAIKEIEHFCKNFVAFKNLEVGNCVNVVNSEMAKTPRRFKKNFIVKY